MATERHPMLFVSKLFSTAIFAAFLAFSGGCGLEDPTAAALIAEAIDERNSEVEEGAENAPSPSPC